MDAMVKWLWIGGFSSVTFALLVVLLMGIDPKAIRIINPSTAPEPEVIGHSIYKRLYLDIRQHQVVMVGSLKELRNYEKIWWGLLASSEYYKDKFDTLIEFEDLKSIEYAPGKHELHRGSWARDELISIVKSKVKEGKKVLLHVHFNDSSHLNAKNLYHELQGELTVPVWSVSQLKFVVTKDNERNFLPKCGKESFLSLLTCKSLEFSKKYYRKKLDANLTQFAMEKHGQKDFLLFVYQPH